MSMDKIYCYKVGRLYILFMYQLTKAVTSSYQHRISRRSDESSHHSSGHCSSIYGPLVSIATVRDCSFETIPDSGTLVFLARSTLLLKYKHIRFRSSLRLYMRMIAYYDTKCK